MSRLHSSVVQRILVTTIAVSQLAATFVRAQQDRNRGLRVEQRPTSTRRIALVIGNSAYKDAPLANPANDARDMAGALRGLGFEVIEGENLSLKDMDRSIRLFGNKIREGGVGLFYYAGHGIQISGTNYLIPVGANISVEQEVKYESIDVGLVLAQMDAAQNSLNIVILDACRNNPFARSFRSAAQGLASIDAPRGTLIAYATAPGSTAKDGAGSNGTYTEELLRYMKAPGLSIEQVFKKVRVAVVSRTNGFQTPWESSSLVGDFYFAGAAAAGSPAVSRTTAVATLVDKLSAPGVEVIDSVTIGRDLYLLFAERVAGQKFLANPDGTRFMLCDLFVARIDNQLKLATVKLGTLFGFNDYERSKAIGIARVHGAIDLDKARLMVFAIEKNNSNDYGMTGHVFRVNMSDLTISSNEIMFTGSNMGWFPIIRNGTISHYSFAGGCFMRDKEQLDNAPFDDAVTAYSNYRFNKIETSNDRGAENYSSSAIQFVSRWQ